MRLLSYMAMDRVLQIGASFGALLLAGQAMPAEEFTHWTATIGMFVSLSAFLYAFPAEPLVRSMLRRPQSLHAARLLLISVIARGGWSITLCLGVFGWLQWANGASPIKNAALFSLLICAALAETMAFAVTLKLRSAAMHYLLKARMCGTLAKLGCMSLAICLKAPLWWMAIGFSLDALLIAVACWWMDTNCQHSVTRQAFSLAGKVNASRLVREAVVAFWRVLPSTAMVVIFNALLRSDRLLLSRSGDISTLSAQSVCMQFIDPAVMFLSGYVNNRFVQGRALTAQQVFQLIAVLVMGGGVITFLGPILMNWLPRNIAEASARFAQAGWLLPSYGCLSLMFYTLYYRVGDRSAGVVLLLFAVVEAALMLLANSWSAMSGQSYLLLCFLTVVSTCLLQCVCRRPIQ